MRYTLVQAATPDINTIPYMSAALHTKVNLTIRMTSFSILIGFQYLKNIDCHSHVMLRG
ncbi:protein of unknown function [Candidatus Nitrotoga arctica]|uniref:Uncharacterized protein n=1 Tax=Candidatus Nitrotoga arctica TaxID=453162 RepID=A0ABM8Z1A0_9PROT|nr:protein of unknown function [Candidatus Nitrotoga arctica]